MVPWSPSSAYSSSESRGDRYLEEAGEVKAGRALEAGNGGQWAGALSTAHLESRLRSPPCVNEPWPPSSRFVLQELRPWVETARAGLVFTECPGDSGTHWSLRTTGVGVRKRMHRLQNWIKGFSSLSAELHSLWIPLDKQPPRDSSQLVLCIHPKGYSLTSYS